jgi:hypothetical protein
MKNTESKAGQTVPLDSLVGIIQSEPEYPDPCTELKKFIHDAVSESNEEWVLHIVRQAVRQTKQSIIDRLNNSNDLAQPPGA